MKTNVIIFLIAALLISSISVIAMMNHSESTNPVAKQCRIQSDIRPADFAPEMHPTETDKQTICGIFGDVKPKDWDEWFEDDVTATT